MRKLVLGIMLATVIAGTASAQGANLNLTIIAQTPSTSISAVAQGSCTLPSPGNLSCALPIAAGQPLATLTIAPTTWTGILVPSGPSVANFAVSSAGNVVTLSAGSTAWTAATCTSASPCSLTLTAAP